MTADRKVDATIVDRFMKFWIEESSRSPGWQTEWSPGRATTWAESQSIRDTALIRRLIVLEFELHWTCGDEDGFLPVERFRSGYRDWCDNEMLLQLVGTEIFCGRNPNPEKYAARFPELRGELERLFRVRSCLQAGHQRERARDLQSLRSVAVDDSAPTAIDLPTTLSREDCREFRQTFEDFRRIGTGSFKDVYLAQQQGLQRQVAFKRLRALSESDRQRFAGESRLQALLDHQNIPPVMLLAEETDGGSVIVEKCVQSPAWSSSICRTGLCTREDLRILLQISRAVAFAHSRGIVHRDIKPDNVLVGEFDQVYLTDWGTAAVYDDQLQSGHMLIRVSSDEGKVVGTPAYMPPELVCGDSHKASPATDVFQLGAVLFQICTGAPPFVGSQISAITLAAIGKCPELPKQVSKEAAAVIRRAMAQDPAERYPNAAAFADEIERLLADENVNACRPLLRDRLRRFTRRHRTLVSTVGAAVSVAAVSAVAVAVILAGKNSQLQAAIADRRRYADKLEVTNRQLTRSESDLRNTNTDLEKTNKDLQTEQDRLKLALQAGFLLLKGVETGQYRTLDDAYADLLQRGGLMSAEDQAGLLPLFQGISSLLKGNAAFQQFVQGRSTESGLLQNLLNGLNRGKLATEALSNANAALTSLDRAVVENPKQGLAWLLRAQLRQEILEQRPHEDVLPDWEKAVALLPNASAAWSGRGFCRIGMKQPEAAIRDLLEAKRLDEKNEYAWLGLCEQCYKLERIDEAIEYSVGALQLQRRYTVDDQWKSRCRNVAMLSYWTRGGKVAGTDTYQSCQDYLTALQYSTSSDSPALWAIVALRMFELTPEQRQRALPERLLCDEERPAFRLAEQVLRLLFEANIEKSEAMAAQVLQQLTANPRLAQEINAGFLEAMDAIVQESGAATHMGVLQVQQKLNELRSAGR
ncbi:MAG: protein kinase domain-containing protein [Planctomyces sp.]|jgi:serine/threonine protein kinase